MIKNDVVFSTIHNKNRQGIRPFFQRHTKTMVFCALRKLWNYHTGSWCYRERGLYFKAQMSPKDWSLNFVSEKTDYMSGGNSCSPRNFVFGSKKMTYFDVLDRFPFQLFSSKLQQEDTVTGRCFMGFIKLAEKKLLKEEHNETNHLANLWLSKKNWPKIEFTYHFLPVFASKLHF